MAVPPHTSGEGELFDAPDRPTAAPRRGAGRMTARRGTLPAALAASSELVAVEQPHSSLVNIHWTLPETVQRPLLATVARLERLRGRSYSELELYAAVWRPVDRLLRVLRDEIGEEDAVQRMAAAIAALRAELPATMDETTELFGGAAALEDALAVELGMELPDGAVRVLFGRWGERAADSC